MKQKAIVLIFAIVAALTALHPRAFAQGVGAGGFNPVLLGLVDTCGSATLDTVTQNIAPSSWSYGGKPPTVNPFSAFPLTSGNGLYIDGNYWNTILGDTIGGTDYEFNYYFLTDSLHLDAECLPDSIKLSFFLKFDSLQRLAAHPLDTLLVNGSVISWPYVQGTINDTLYFLYDNVWTSAILGLDSLRFNVAWKSGRQFDLDGARLEATYTVCGNPTQNIGMRVFIDNCEPISVYDFASSDIVDAIANAEKTISRRLDTLISRTPPCLTTGELEIIHCIGGDTITVSANYANSVTLCFKGSCSDCIFLGGNWLDYDGEAANWILPIQADDCQLLKTEVKFACQSSGEYFLIVK